MIPKWRFFVIGFLEALGLVAGMSSGGTVLIMLVIQLDFPFLFCFFNSIILVEFIYSSEESENKCNLRHV